MNAVDIACGQLMEKGLGYQKYPEYTSDKEKVTCEKCKARKLEYVKDPVIWSSWARLPETEREDVKKRGRERRQTDIRFRLNAIMSSRMRNALKKPGKEGRHWEELVGYSIEKLERRLKRTMPDGYMWEDFLKGRLHIDHIIPVSAFNFTSIKHIDFRRCWSLKNLRFLPKEENLRKRDKLKDNFQPCLKV